MLHVHLSEQIRPRDTRFIETKTTGTNNNNNNRRQATKQTPPPKKKTPQKTKKQTPNKPQTKQNKTTHLWLTMHWSFTGLYVLYSRAICSFMLPSSAFPVVSVERFLRVTNQRGSHLPSSGMMHSWFVFVVCVLSSRTRMSGSYVSMKRNACVHRQDLGLRSHWKELKGVESKHQGKKMTSTGGVKLMILNHAG